MARYFILFWMWYQYFSNKEVKSVFYFDLKPARKIFADFRTFASYLAVELKDFSVLLLKPFFLFYSGMQLINESLSYFLSVFLSPGSLKAASGFFIFSDQFEDGFIFLGWPLLTKFIFLWQSSISLQTLVLVSFVHVSGYFCPFFGYRS